MQRLERLADAAAAAAQARIRWLEEVGGAVVSPCVAVSPAVASGGPGFALCCCSGAAPIAAAASGAITSSEAEVGVLACGDVAWIAPFTAASCGGAVAAAAAGDEAAAAQEEVRILLRGLRALLIRLSAVASSAGHALDPVLDVAFIHLYLADMAMFGPVNAAYCAFFARHPPSRSCVALPLVAAGGARVAIDAVVVRGSGAALRGVGVDSGPGGSTRTYSRAVLHVASLSRWAPLCIGPYCQANTILSAEPRAAALPAAGDGGMPLDGLVLLAGQIGLQPWTMSLVLPDPAALGGRHGAAAALLAQLRQSCRNALRVHSCANPGGAAARHRWQAITAYLPRRLAEGGGGAELADALAGALAEAGAVVHGGADAAVAGAAPQRIGAIVAALTAMHLAANATIEHVATAEHGGGGSGASRWCLDMDAAFDAAPEPRGTRRGDSDSDGDGDGDGEAAAAAAAVAAAAGVAGRGAFATALAAARDAGWKVPLHAVGADALAPGSTGADGRAVTVVWVRSLPRDALVEVEAVGAA